MIILILQDGMNVVDVLAIMPFFVSLFFGSGSEFGSNESESSGTKPIPTSGELDDSQKGGMDEILQVILCIHQLGMFSSFIIKRIPVYSDVRCVRTKSGHEILRSSAFLNWHACSN